MIPTDIKQGTRYCVLWLACSCSRPGLRIRRRYGGEEFCMILPGADAAKAMEIAEAFRTSVEEMVLHHEGKQLRVTVSAGVSLFDPEQDARTSKAMIERADRALYACKNSGRNRVILFDDSLRSV